MAVSGYNTCEFQTYTSKGIHVVKVNFNADFWKTVLTKVISFIVNKWFLPFSWKHLRALNSKIGMYTKDQVTKINKSNNHWSEYIICISTLCSFYIN